MRDTALPRVGGLNNSFPSLTPFSDSLGTNFTVFLLLPPSLYKHSYGFPLEKNSSFTLKISSVYFHSICIVHIKSEAMSQVGTQDAIWGQVELACKLLSKAEEERRWEWDLDEDRPAGYWPGTPFSILKDLLSSLLREGLRPRRWRAEK